MTNIIQVRQAHVDDSGDIFHLMNTVTDLDNHVLLVPESFKSRTIEQEEQFIKRMTAKENCNLFVAIIDDRIVGIGDIHGSSDPARKHSVSVGVSVHPEFRRIGVASRLMQQMDEWIGSNRTIEKITLSVLGNNSKAIGLYRKLGYEQEGVMKKDLRSPEGEYIDVIKMAKFMPR